ncbi:MULTISPECIES: metallophosphoesterase family protein [Pontibacillus]|uniref:DNA repair exonuclease n=1 Tax=Pontibacillus chungwhensis TaxID=265426 RepID=A0ABY8V1N3_9BACI|nr:MULTISPECIES: DNA repair exonuclease [Pontibacillus]MCD5324952.1 DNA repair exonuclease [Pontibacillus sp. HN14]WIF98911.1 DNA repair exonuclease [Pontibacillus chungwhensis]
MKPTLRFIHCADLHLDSPFKGIGSGLAGRLYQEVVESTFQAFERVISHAVENKVDFVLMVGDLFDQDGRSLKAQIRLKNGFQTLHKAGINVFVSHGNHDHTGGSFYPVEYPENVTIFKEESVSVVPFYKNGEHVANIEGFSYPERAVYEEKVGEYKRSEEDVFHIGMLHGSIATNTDHDVYAPFRLGQLNEVGLDYWALGHIHKRQILQDDPPVVYPGNIQGRHQNESGEKGCYLIELGEGDTTLTFLATSAIRFMDVSFDSVHSSIELYEQVEHWKEKNRNTLAPVLVKVVVEGSNMEGAREREALRDLIDIWNEAEEEESSWIWIQSLVTETKPTWDREELKEGSHFIADLIRHIDSKKQEVDQIVSELTSHKQGRKYIGSFTEEEKKEIVRDAETYLLTSLLEKERTE